METSNRASSFSWRGGMPAVLLLATAITVLFLGSHGFLESTEGRYAESAREMVETGNWLIPQLDYHPHWTKPPVTYWAIAGGMKLLGENEWGARFCNGLAFILTVWAVGYLGTLLWDRRTGVTGSLIYAVSPFAVYGGGSIQTDMLLSLAQILTVICYFHAVNAEGVSSKRWVIFLWIAAGVAFLVKGPPSLLTLAALFAYQFYRRKRGLFAPRLLSIWGLLAFLIVGGSWFAVVIAKTPGLFSYYLRDEVAGRIFTAHADRNAEWYKPFVVYLPILLFGAGPIALLWPILAKRNSSVVRWGSFKRLFAENDRAAFLILWLGISVVVLSLAKSRLPLYLLPFFPAIALGTARVGLNAYNSPRFMRALWSISLAVGVVIIGVKAGVAFVPIKADMRPLYNECMKTWGPDAQYFVLNSIKHYGLQFYLKGHLTRLVCDGTTFPEADTPTNALVKLGADSKRKTWVLLDTSRKDGCEITFLLDKLGVKYEKQRTSAGFTAVVAHPN